MRNEGGNENNFFSCSLGIVTGIVEYCATLQQGKKEF